MSTLVAMFGLVALPIGLLADAIGIRETLALMGGAVIASIAIIQFVGRVKHIEEDRFARVLMDPGLEAAGSAGGR